jgi:hypothetical protein
MLLLKWKAPRFHKITTLCKYLVNITVIFVFLFNIVKYFLSTSNCKYRENFLVDCCKKASAKSNHNLNSKLFLVGQIKTFSLVEMLSIESYYCARFIWNGDGKVNKRKKILMIQLRGNYLKFVKLRWLGVFAIEQMSPEEKILVEKFVVLFLSIISWLFSY